MTIMRLACAAVLLLLHAHALQPIAAGARPAPHDQSTPPAYTDWHYPSEEQEEAARLPPLHVVAADTASQVCNFTNGTHNHVGARPGDVVLGGWVMLAVVPAGASSTHVHTATCVVEYRFTRWGQLRYLTPSIVADPAATVLGASSSRWGEHGGVVVSLRTGIGCVSCLEPLRHRAFNFTQEIPGYWDHVRDDPHDYLGTRILADGKGEPTYADAAKYMAQSRDFAAIGHPSSTMTWVVMHDGRIKRGDGSQVHPDNGHAPVPGLLVFEPNKTVTHWPEEFTSYKSSLVGGYLRAVHMAAYDDKAGAGFEQLAFAPNATAAQVLVRVGELKHQPTTTGTPTHFRYFRAGDHGPDLKLVGQYQEEEQSGQRFYTELLKQHQAWHGPLYLGGDSAMSVQLPFEDRRLADMAVGALTAGLTLFRDLVPNYGTGEYWSLYFNKDTPTVPCRLDEGACAALPMQSFALDNALLEWGLLEPARARIAFFFEHFVRVDGTLNMQNWNSPSAPDARRCPFDGVFGGNESSPQMNDGLSDYGRAIDMWVAAAQQQPGTAAVGGVNTAAFVNKTLATVLAMGRYMLRLRNNATAAIAKTSALHGMVWGPAEHDTCPAPDYYLSVQAWFWRGEVELGTWLQVHGAENTRTLSELLLQDAAALKQQIQTAVATTVVKLEDGKTFLPPILCEPNATRPHRPTCAEIRTPFINLTQPFPKDRANQSIASYSNFRYYGETLLAEALPPGLEDDLLDYRASHGATLAGMTRYKDHLDDMPAAGYGFASLLHADDGTGANEARFHLLFAGHLANYQSRGTFAASEQMSIYGDGVFRDHLGYAPVDAQYCVPAEVLAAYFLKWSLVFSPREPRQLAPPSFSTLHAHSGTATGTTTAPEVWLAHGAPRRWYDNRDGFGATRAPTRHGVAVTFHVQAAAVAAPVTAPTKAAAVLGPQQEYQSQSRASHTWETTANVTLVRAAKGRGGGNGRGSDAGVPLVVQLRLRCSSTAASAGAVLESATAVGAEVRVLRWNATTETVAVALSPGTWSTASFSVAARFGSKAL